jgi:putative membrane protein
MKTAVPTMGSPHKQVATEGEQAFQTSDKLFLWRVHWINHQERQAGDLAKSRGKVEGVADYGTRLANDHSQNEKKLLALAKKKDIELTLKRDEYQKVRDVLAAQMTMQMDLVHEDTDTFDQEFLTHMADGHLAAIDLLRSYRGKTKDADVRAFIDETLPVLQDHHEVATTLLERARNERQDVKGKDEKKGAPSTQPREVPRTDKPEEGVDRQEGIEEDIERRTEPAPHEEQRVPPQ